MHLTAGKFLFLGDYVDRGLLGLETLAYLFSLKVRIDVRNKIDNFPNTNDVMARQQYVVSIFSILTKYEFLETMSLLELAIWKTKIEDDDDYYSEEEPLRKRAKLDHHSTVDEISVSTRKRRHRQYCRINCGAEIIITNILPYLG